MCEDNFHPSEFNYLIYQASSGGLSCPDSDARISYYGVTGYPTVKFDGYYTEPNGGSTAVIDGTIYAAVIESHRAELQPLAVAVSDWSFESGSAFAEVKVKLFGDLAGTAGTFIRIAVVEDDLFYSGTLYRHTLRDMLPDQALTIDTDGQEQTVTVPITMNPAWNPDNMFLIAFVQRDSDRFIYNSSSSQVGEFAVMAAVDGPQQVVAEGASVTFGDINLMNVGLAADTFDVTLDTSALPEGWDAHLTHDGVDGSSFQIALEPFGSTSLNVTMDAGESGSGRVVVRIFSQGSGAEVETLEFAALAGGTDLLVVADDDGAGHAYSSYAPAIDATGHSYAVWDRSLAAIGGESLGDYDAVIWETGGNSSCMQADDRAALDTYLAAGGRVILAGEDLIESLYQQGGSARLWYQFKLYINYASGNSNDLDVVGVADDPVGGGLSFTLTGGDPDMISIFDYPQYVGESFRYVTADGVAGARSMKDGYKVVTLPFGLERVAAQEDRDAILENCLVWLDVQQVLDAGDTPDARTALMQNVPNPFNPATRISFRTDRDGPTRLEIFDAHGRSVRTLIDAHMPAGVHEATWDGRTGSSRQAASGTYFYRLESGGVQQTRKMTLVK